MSVHLTPERKGILEQEGPREGGGSRKCISHSLPTRCLVLSFSSHCERLIFLSLQGVGERREYLEPRLPPFVMVMDPPSCLLESLAGMEDESDEGVAR